MERVVSVFDNIDSTRSLTRWAAANNLLHHMEKTCHYLAATGDTDTLTAYVSTLRDHFHSDSRWTFFNRKLVEVAGAWWRPHAA
ncbi:hypothetical protein EB73_20140 [Mycobacterium sp. SWH-M3]|nr:hypothetical protein EB73_20140 [Mycobacterium sp. SWH-M3]